MANAMFSFFNNLPNDTVIQIFDNSTREDQAKLAQVNKFFKQMASDHSLELARYKFFQLIRKGNLTAIRTIVNLHPNLIVGDVNRKSILENMIGFRLGVDQKQSINHLEIIQFFLEKGAKTISVDKAKKSFEYGYEYAFCQLLCPFSEAGLMLITNQHVFPNEYFEEDRRQEAEIAEQLVQTYQPRKNIQSIAVQSTCEKIKSQCIIL